MDFKKIGLVGILMATLALPISNIKAPKINFVSLNNMSTLLTEQIPEEFQIKEMSTSKRGKDLIKKYEGFTPIVKDDIGWPAIGYGHRLLPGERYTCNIVLSP